MKQPVRQEHRQLGDEIAAPLVGLAAGGRDAHHDVAQQAVRVVSVLALVLGESQYVGGSILTAIDSVQLLDLIIARKKYRKLSVTHLNRVKHGTSATRNVGPRHARIRAFFHDQPYGHRSLLLASARRAASPGAGQRAASSGVARSISAT
ncbi:MAG TPA: hypothetical protein VH044_01685 [Polyangiaceae bacterium]|nr:hypothetical protein [Polyangiaceae bacterium]